MSEVEVKSRKLAILFVEPSGFASLFKKGMRFRANIQIAKGIPDDASVVGIFSDPQRHGVMIMLQSETFKPVLMGVLPPILPIEIKL